jgi:hypothetical protein
MGKWRWVEGGDWKRRTQIGGKKPVFAVINTITPLPSVPRVIITVFSPREQIISKLPKYCAKWPFLLIKTSEFEYHDKN